MTATAAAAAVPDGPMTLIAELTYACPLRCAYCSNPIALGDIGGTLATSEWLRVFAEAEALGVVQLHLTGGEPLLRSDLEELVAGARALDLYVNLITSGVPLTRDRLTRLRRAGLDAIQLSFQGAHGGPGAVRIAGVDRHREKLAVAGWARELDMPLTINCVIHAGNIDEVDGVIRLAERLGAHRLELASTQFLGWALVNRDALLPDAGAIERARSAAAVARARLAGRMEVIYVLPDHHAGRPRPCMGGWARSYLLVAPDGLALPCHAARDLPLEWWNVRERAMSDIWRRAPGFVAYRGHEWMPSPCSTCDRRDEDFGGCRCQAFALTGSATATDPACERAPSHHLVRLGGARAVSPLRLRSTGSARKRIADRM
jgi:PqqA peptide cyclase